MTMRNFIATVALALGCGSQVSALPVDWVIDYSNSVDNAVVTGSFTYDASTNQFSNIDVDSNNDSGVGTTSISMEFLDPAIAPSATRFGFTTSDQTNRNGVTFVVFDLLVALTDAGGTLVDNFTITPNSCRSADCLTFDTRPQGLTGEGTLTGTPTTVMPVPLPASGLLLLSGLLGFGWCASRSKKA